MKLVLAALAVTTAVSGFQWRPLNYSTPSTSMAPTLNPGDYLLLPALFQGAPRRGDVVVFDTPDGSGGTVVYVKRVVGLPGDTVQYVGGALRIEGVKVGRTPVALPGQASSQASPAQAYRETIGDAAYDIIEQVENGFLDDTQQFKVPEGAYFTLGDNRDNSTDSRIRMIGYVAKDAIVGRVCFVFRFPFSFRNICRATSQPAANSPSE